MNPARKTGDFGERSVARYLKKRKCKILARQFRSKTGEIDIVAMDSQYIMFVEVKTRSGEAAVRPSAAVDFKKRRRLLLTAKYFLRLYPCDLQPRMDVAEVRITGSRWKKDVAIDYYPNAFSPEDSNGLF